MRSSSQRLLTDKETKELLKKAQYGDKAAKELLVEANIRLVNSIALRFKTMGKEYEDIFQVGCLGLLKAINNFNLKYEVCFSTYAVPLIMGEIRRFIRDDMPITVSRTLKEQAQTVKRGREELVNILGNEPTMKQLAVHLAMPVEQIALALESLRPLTSIYDATYHDDGDAVYILDSLKNNDSEKNFEKLFIESLLTGLSPREKRVLELRYEEDKTQSETGRILGISQVQVSRIERAAIMNLREKAQKTD